MESENRNALAELAEKINADRGIFRAFKNYLGDKKDEVGRLADEDLRKASCIIAELAKASDAIGYADEFAKDGFKDCIYIPATQELCVKKILKCRAIAEEE